MADEDREDPTMEEEEDGEEWTEPVDLSELPDGNKTVFVGGFSTIKTINEALPQLKTAKDRVIVLKGSYEGDVTIDSTKWKGLIISGEEGSNANDVKIDGALNLDWSKPEINPDAEEEAAVEEPASPVGEDGEGGAEEGGDAGEVEAKPKVIAQPKLLTLSKLTFLKGAVVNAQTAADIVECNFGTKTGSHAVPHTVQCHGFSTVMFRRCRIYGTQRSAVYCYPRSSALLDRCDIIGSEKPAPQSAPVKHKRGYVPPPPPPPTAPTKCECEVGAFCDDATSTFKECTFSQFDLGIFTRDKCKGNVFDRCALSLIANVGLMIDTGSQPAIRNSVIKLCGRECIVVGINAHPTLRNNTFVGDVRLKRGAVATGMSDNTVGLSGKVIDDDGTFVIKGFHVVEQDPTAPKPKKMVKAEE